jgi:threonine/homoserine/homoserine lactone efflux protein
MALWQLFVVVAGAHFLALLSPGPDFVLILRSSLAHGLRRAWAVCVGIALANGIFVLLALSGVTLLHESGLWFVILKWAGCAYLGWLGWRFLRHRGNLALPEADRVTVPATSLWHEFVSGFLSGILNPKNSLFYASLFTLVMPRGTPLWAQAAYGAWMFLAVLGWDLLVAATVGQPQVVRSFVRHVRGVERVTGVLLLSIALGVALSAR